MAAIVKGVESLTAELFSRLLDGYRDSSVVDDHDIDSSSTESSSFNRNIQSKRIQSLDIQPVEQGVLSQVYRITLKYSGEGPTTPTPAPSIGNNSNRPRLSPSQWIVKLRRQDLHLGWMFECESTFYSHFVKQLVTTAAWSKSIDTNIPTDTTLPFDIPSTLYCSNDCIILEGIPNVTCYELSGGCPDRETFLFCLDALASWHATCWKAPVFNDDDSSSCSRRSHLSCPPGIGQRMSGLQKEYLFGQGWKDFLEHAISTSDQGGTQNNDQTDGLLDASRQLLQRLEPLRLRDVHNQVHAQSRTCVHGDYHIANWLFPNELDMDNSDKPAGINCSNRKPVLIDWATCGYGNPMIDVAFFLIASTTDEIVSDFEPWLQRYYKVLTTTTREATRVPIDIDYETCREWFGWCLINQLLILVAYDEMCRNIALAEPDPAKQQAQLNHFQNVNRRVLLAVVQMFGNSSNDTNSTKRSRSESKESSGGSNVGKESKQHLIFSSVPKITPEEQREARLYSEKTPLAI